jgi:LacI family transcriptional regulator
VSTARGRLAGYRRVLRRHHLGSPPEYVATEETGDESGVASGYHAMVTLLGATPRPDGVFCYNDPSALGAMQAIFDAGLDVPEDVAVVGCGNVLYAPFLRVPLSSVDQQSDAIGARAGELALMLIDARLQPKPARILLEPTVVARGSTARSGHQRLLDDRSALTGHPE